MSKQIIVGFDHSDGARAAVQWAADEAILRGCQLNVVFSYKIPVSGDLLIGLGTADIHAIVIDSATKVLDQVAAGLRVSHPDLDVVTSATVQLAWAALVEAAHVGDLIVVGASAHKGAKAFWLGSTPRAVARHAPCPVVVVRGPVEPHRPERVVVGFDGSDAATDALRWAVDAADRLGTPVQVVHAWEYSYGVLAGDVPMGAVDFATSQARDLTRVDAACVLEAGVDLARERANVDIDGVLVEGTPASALLSYVHDGDLLVIGTRGRSALAGAFGSTANAILDRANVPVVVVRDTDS
jgi:nucleotide-binding universal stress UspA family protein